MTKLTFLGTGGVFGTPAWNCKCKTCAIARKRGGKDKRMRSSILVEQGKKKILVDIGPDFKQQMKRFELGKLDFVLVTHSHDDHSNNLFELALAKDCTLASSPEVMRALKKKYSGSLDWAMLRNPSLQTTAFRKLEIGGLTVRAVGVSHAKDTKKTSTATAGFIFENNKSKVFYASDFDKLPEGLPLFDVMIVDGTRWEHKSGHLGIKEGLKLYKKLKPKKMLFTHVLHDNLPHEELEKKVVQSGNVGIAYDGLEIVF